jgi:hypothetical protein
MPPTGLTDPEIRILRGPSKAVWAGRILSGLITAMLLFASVQTLRKQPDVIEGSARVGVPETAITGIGLALLVSTVLYAIPATTGLGAILLTGYLGGAVMAHVHTQDPAWMVVVPIVFGALVWLGVVLRDSRLRQIVPIRR